MAKRKGMGRGWWGEPIRHSRAAKLGWKRRKRRLAMLQRELQKDPFIFPIDTYESTYLGSGRGDGKGKYHDNFDWEFFVKQKLEGVHTYTTKEDRFLVKGYVFELDRNGEKYKYTIEVVRINDKTFEIRRIRERSDRFVDIGRIITITFKRKQKFDKVADAIGAYYKEAFEKGFDVQDADYLLRWALDESYSRDRDRVAAIYSVLSRDKSRTAKVVLDPNNNFSWLLWLKDPDKYDLKGYDTPTTILYQNKLQKAKRQWLRNHVIVKYDVKRKEKELKKILEPKLIKILNDSFTLEELKKIGNIEIRMEKAPIGYLGYKTTSKVIVTPNPKLRDGKLIRVVVNRRYFEDEETKKSPRKIAKLVDTIVHEVVHALRDAQDRDSVLRGEEEAQTVAETIVRVPKGITKHYVPGYYHYIYNSEEAKKAFLEDVELLKGKHSKEIKGKRAIKRVLEKYDKTNIKQLEKYLRGKYL